MIDVYVNGTNELVGSITDADLKVLVDALEEESSEDPRLLGRQSHYRRAGRWTSDRASLEPPPESRRVDGWCGDSVAAAGRTLNAKCKMQNAKYKKRKAEKEKSRRKKVKGRGAWVVKQCVLLSWRRW